MPSQPFHSQQLPQSRPSHPSSHTSQPQPSATHGDVRKLSGNQHLLPHQNLPGNTSVNSSLAQNQTSGAMEHFHSTTAGQIVPPPASIHSTSVRAQGHDGPKPKGGGRRMPRPSHNQGAEMPYLPQMRPDKFPPRMRPAFDPQQMMQQMARMSADPRFMQDPRVMHHFMQQMAKQHMAFRSQQQQPPPAHAPHHGDVPHLHGAPQPAHGAPVQHPEIPGQRSKVTSSERSILTYRSFYPVIRSSAGTASTFPSPRSSSKRHSDWCGYEWNNSTANK